MDQDRGAAEILEFAGGHRRRRAPRPLLSSSAAGNGIVYKLNASTGRVVWSRFIDTCASSAVSVTASLVYVGGCNLYALSASTGRVVWRTSQFGPEVTTPTIVDHRVIASTVNGSGSYTGAAAFNATTGRRLWLFRDATANAPVTAADGVVFIDEGSDVGMLDSGNGTFIGDLFPPPGSTFNGSVVLAEGRVYVCTVAMSNGVATLRAYQPEH